MASASTTRAGRPRKASTAATQPPTGSATPAAEAPTPSAAGPSTAAGAAYAAVNLNSMGPTTQVDCENLATQLLDSAIPIRKKLDIAVELRDSAESNRDHAFYEKYLAVFIPTLMTILGDEKHISFVKDSLDQRFRNALLNFLQRLPHNEPYRQHEKTVLELMVRLLRVENDENALVCIKVIIDGVRTHKEQAEPVVEPFLEVVKEMYRNLKGTVEKEFGPASAQVAIADGSAPASSGAESSGPSEKRSPQALSPALHSPKVLTECPIAVVLVFQTYKTAVANTMLDFYPLALACIQIQPEPQRLAYEEYKAKGEVFVGVATGIQNREMYADLLKAQVKTVAFLAYVLRSANLNVKDYIEVFPDACIRLLRDCPTEDFGTRKELLVATRHILSSDSRSAFVPFIDSMLDERIICGTGITSRDILRPLAYSIVADLIHHVRSELSIEQLSRVAYIFGCNIVDPSFSNSIQTMCAKLLNTIVETIHQKGDPAEWSKLMRSMFFSCLEKLSAMSDATDRMRALAVRDKGKGKAKEQDADGDVVMDGVDAAAAEDRLLTGWRDIEMAMPVKFVAYAGEPYEAYARDARFLFKTVLYTFRTLLQYTRQGENPLPSPDGHQLASVFEHTIRGVVLLDGVREPREAKDIIELITQLHLMFEPHVFSEVWSSHMDFFVQHCLTSQHVFPIIQILINHESVSHQLVSICLKYLMKKLPELGTYTKNHASLILRLYKMSFVAINNNIQTHEAILVPHLQKLILDAFKFAAQATEPAMYYQVLRALFRSIGGGRFEALYKEVLPILQEMLDTLAYLLNHAATDSDRDLFVELTLTVPVRLTNLLPYLSYLMRPLVFALRAGPEQVSQGLRTLELCIDNLTADFLDPTMTPILADLMAALHRLLKPIPADRKHANAAIKILGKLGGRTRRFVEVDLDLEYRAPSAEISLPITLEGKTHKMPLSSMIEAASSAVEDDIATYREDGLQALMISAMSVLQEDGPMIEGNTVFSQAMSGLYLACARESVKDKAITFVRDYCRRVLASELNRTEQRPSGPAAVIMEVGHVGRKRHLPLTSAVSDCFVDTLANASTEDREKLGDLLVLIIDDFRGIAANPEFSEKFDTSRSVDRMIQTFSHRFAALCHEEDWRRKMAGVGAMKVLINKINISRKLLLDLEVDMVRALLYCLRDSPKDPPSSADDVVDLLKQIIKTCQSEEDGSSRVPKLTETLVLELNSQSKLSRDAAHEAIELLAESLSQSLSELLAAPVKAKLFDVSTGPIFSKPLRALPFGHQVGIIDAVTYVMNIRPAILEPSDELVRFLHEVLALADVEDEQLLMKPITHKNETWVRTLRIACLRLLRSAMNAPDFLNKPTLSTVRGRIIQVYFKHVYSSNTEIVDVAHEGLRDCLEQQSKLPKEILQTGLRPILVNLADAKRLSVSGLDGLARFLELLTTYFKVEIGVKLLEHFNSLGEPATLAKAAYSPLEDNPEIMRMTRLINIFRLLPSTAVMYLTNLVTSVVDAEAHLHQYTQGPFTINLAKYLDKFYVEGAQNLIDNIRNPRYIWTFRNVIASGAAPQLVEELSNRVNVIIETCFSNHDAVEFVLPGLYLLLELSRTSPSWLTEHESVLEPLVNVWRSITSRSRLPKADMSAYHYQQMPPVLLEMFISTLKDKPNVHLLFHLVEAYEIRSSFEKSQVAFFLYQHVALHESVEYRKEIIDAYFNLYENEDVTWAFKANALRLIVNPIFKVYFDDPKNDGSLVTSQLTATICTLMWKPLSNPAIARIRDDDLLVEIYHLTSILVGECVPQMTDVRKEVFKFAWMGINILEPTVKLIAYIVTAKFMVNFDTPIKFVRLTWVGLLRLKDTENFRTLYREAIDALAIAVTKRDVPTAIKDPAIAGGAPAVQHMGIPDWAARVRTILVEEGHANNVVMTVCELLVNHPDMFYDYRELYVPYIANSVGKLGFAQAAGAEHKKLTIDAVELIYKWEKRRMTARDEARESDAMDVDETGSGSKRIRAARDGSEASPLKRQRLDRAGTVGSSSSGGGWAAPTQVKELMTAHLLRLISTSNEPVQKGGLTKRALDLFKEILGPSGLPAVYVKLTFFTRTMNAEINDSSINAIANSTEVIAAVAASKDQAWIRQNLSLLANLLDKVFVCEDATLHEIITPLTEKLFLELPESEEADASEEAINWYKFVSNAVHDGLISSQRSSSHLPGTLFLLRHWLKVQPRQLQSEAISSGLMRVLGNLVKVHTSSGPEQAHRLIIAILDIVRDRVHDIREQRRNLHAILLQLIERSPNLALCRYLLDLLRDWVLKDPEIKSQGKEKAALLKAMLVFRNRDDALFHRYLDLVYDIYQIDDLRPSDLTHKLEVAFLFGTRSKDGAQRQKFMNKFEQSMSTSLDGRLLFLFSLRNWENLADTYWIPQILGPLLGLLDFSNSIIRKNILGVMENDPVLDLAKRMTAEDLITPARNLIHLSPDFAHKLWTAVFPMCWSSLSRAQQSSFTPYIATLLSQEWHRRQVESRRNVIHTMLAGVLACSPVVTLPSLLVKYLCKTYNAWYVGFEILTKLSDVYKSDDNLRETCNTALSELYAELCEDDMFYGLARSRCVYQETTAALTLEQNGQYPRAMELYEQAQSKARAGALPFSEEEYCFWEDHWILCAQKLQHWDSLTELARTDQDSDLLLECAWRLSDWGSPDRDTIEANLQRLSDVPTPRRKTFEAFTALLRAHSAREPPNDFLRILDEAQQISLRKWVSLPAHTTAAHLPLLQMFQQCIELNEASSIFDSLQQTTAQNLEARVNGEVKSLFSTWRERLPNFWDDIAVWSDMLAWRQHVFQAATKVYVPLIDPADTATIGFRGYHETAWTINRFGEVARRHGLLDVCSLSLNKIYQLPNIEISEAFLKLKEQALCYFQKVDKFNEGLDNISTTNLAYFSPAQKAEFLTLKGMFIAKLGQNENANAEFAHAIQMDMSLPRAWAEWGHFNDRIYGSRPEMAQGPPPEPEPGQPRMTPEEFQAHYTKDRSVFASSAVSCYLTAAGLYMNHKSRGMLLRVLWLIAHDDQFNTITKAFENYRGEMAIWYWITLAPQLIISLSRREAKQARLILMCIAKQHPQAIFYQLRVSKEDNSAVRRQTMAQRAAAARKAQEQAKATAAAAAAATTSASTPAPTANGETPTANGTANAAANGDASVPPTVKVEAAPSTAPTPAADVKDENAPTPASAAPPTAAPTPAASQSQPTTQPAAAVQAPGQPNPQARQPWELVEEIMNVLKTSFPLLTLTMEKMVDQISLRAKPASDEDIYRFFAALLSDALQQYGARSLSPGDDGELVQTTKDNLVKFSSNLAGDLKLAIEQDFMRDTPKLREYIRRLQSWRDNYERALDARPRMQPLDQGGCNLIEFHHTKFDEIEVPGQYVHHIDQGEELIKIARFAPKAEMARGHGHCFRRITMIGNNGSLHTFNVQLPAARHCRREERLTQLFRIMNSVLKKRKEARRRNLQFHLPTAVPLAPQLRLVENDSSYISLQDIYDDYCLSKGHSREDSIMTFYDRIKQLHDPTFAKNDPRLINLKCEVLEEIQAKMVPENIMTNYMIKTMSSSESLWLMRKQFAVQTAAVNFLTYVCCLNNRAPNRFHLSRKTGLMYMTEILPAFGAGQPLIQTNEAVPFRLTPNMQHFITRVGIEGVVTAATTAIARSLTRPEFELGPTLQLFIKEELTTWYGTYMKENKSDAHINQTVPINVDNFVRRANTMGYLGDQPDVDKNGQGAPSGLLLHAVVTLISQATSPTSLAQMNEVFMSWY